MRAYRIGAVLSLLGLLVASAIAQNSSVIPAGGSTSIAPLVIEDTNTVSQRNGTNKQRFSVMGTYTDSSNYSKILTGLNDDGNTWGIATQAAGTAVNDGNLNIQIGGNWSGTNFGLNANQTIYIGGYTLRIGGGGAPATLYGGNAELQVEVESGWVRFNERTAPSAPAANKVLLYAEDNGSGKTRLMALFPTGAAQQVAIEP